MNVGDLVARFLSEIGAETVFAIISVHNIPIMDGIARRGGMHVVMTRGEMGASHMADGWARISGKIGVLITSTGPGAANAVSGLLEASFASSPLLHITGQVPSKHLGRDSGTTHGVKDQFGMLESVSKSTYRVSTASEVWGVLSRAVADALTAPMGPVSVEIPIDIQKQEVRWPDTFEVSLPGSTCLAPSTAALDKLVEAVLSARRPMLWVGSGARDCSDILPEFLEMGFGMVSSWSGRGIVPEDHPRNLGALNGSGSQIVEGFYRDVDLMLVVGSRLRGQETVDQSIALPARRIQIDIDSKANGRTYEVEHFVHGDCRSVMQALLERIRNRVDIDNEFPSAFEAMKRRARECFKATLGPYANFAEDLRRAVPRDALWIRDITVANSTWGHRLYEVYEPRVAAHPVGAGIGQGLPMAIGAAFASAGRKTVLLSGDAGFVMNIGELWTAKQENLEILMIIMNDAGYGVIKHMQDAGYGGRRVYGDLDAPDFASLSQCLGIAYMKVSRAEDFASVVSDMVSRRGMGLVEVDMSAIGEAPPYHPFLKPGVTDAA